MVKSDVQEQAATRLLDRGVRFKMPAPLIFRLLRLNKITIKPFRPGTILEFSRIVLKHKLEDAILLDRHEQLIETIRPIARCIAVAALNSRLKIAWLTPIFTRWLLWRLSYVNLIEMFAMIVELNKAQDFTIITKFFCQQTAMMMSPRNLGQQANGE